MSRKDRKAREQYKAPEQQDNGKEKARPNVSFKPKNEGQHEYLYSLLSSDCTIVRGPAGTGKTYLAASVAAQRLANRKIKQIIISRPNVPTGKSLGAFPGTIEEKMAPWLLPITDVLRKHLGGLYDYAVKTGDIQIQPVETIRGRSFDDAMVLFDESQQLTREELKAIVTRIGENSSLVLMGDSTQRDINVDGLEWLVGIADKYNLPVEEHVFTSDDVVRSGICKAFVVAFEKEDNQ